MKYMLLNTDVYSDHLQKMSSLIPSGEGLIRPHDYELVFHLRDKADGFDDPRIPVLNIYGLDPWELPYAAGINSNDKEWYFFCPNRKKGDKRTTKTGQWKVSSKDRKINYNGKEIGIKTYLVFFKGRAPDGERTKWKIHEFNLPNRQGPFVLCKLMDNSVDDGNIANYYPESGGSNIINPWCDMTSYSTIDAGESSRFAENQAIDSVIPRQEGGELPPYPVSVWDERNYSSNYELEFHVQAQQQLYYDNLGIPTSLTLEDHLHGPAPLGPWVPSSF